MLSGGKIDSLVAHLEHFKVNDSNRQADLEGLLKEYSQLLSDYQILKNAFEQKNARAATSKQLIAAPTLTAQNSYVLVLVDGNGYIFNDELIREKEEGGMRAARMLNDAVEKYLQQSVPEARTSRIIVRIYADLTNLSKQLAKSKVTGLEKRSVAPFSAAFTRAISLFDFVDALDEEGSKFKIREQFKLAFEDSNCRHILFAGCHDSAYLSQLTPSSGGRAKVTLVQGAGWNPDFHQFNLNITQFPTVFRWSGLPGSVPATKATGANGSPAIKAKAAQKPGTLAALSSLTVDSWRNSPLSAASSLLGNNEMAPIDHNGSGNGGSIWGNASAANPKESQDLCKFFQKGFCRFGNKCTFQHVSPNLSSSSQSLPPTTSDRSNISVSLPITLIEGFVPLNKDGQRLDTYVRPPTTQEWQIYNARFHKQKPCNSWHLQGNCTTLSCPYDHNELEFESRHVLEYVLKCTPCPKRSACRASDCFYGHICQKDGCSGQMKGCRIKADLHSVDPKLGSMVPAEDEHVREEASGGLEMPDEGNFMW